MKNKPFTLIIRELDNEVIDVLNRYQLPAHTLITELQKMIDALINQDEVEIEQYLREQEVDKDAKDK